MSTPRDFSLAHATLLDLPPLELVRIAAATGYRIVGFRLIPIDRPGEPRHVLPAGSERLQDVKRLLADTGLRLLDIEVAIVREDIDPRTYLPMFEAAAELGARYVLTNVYAADRPAAVEGLQQMAELAAPFGLAPVLEFVSFSRVPTLGDALEVIAATRRRDVGLLFDMLHFHSTHGRPEDLARIPQGLLSYVHLDDGPAEIPDTVDGLRQIAREARLFPGEGGADYRGVLPRLPQDVPYAVEVINPSRAREMGADAFARFGLEQTRRCFEQSLP